MAFPERNHKFTETRPFSRDFVPQFVSPDNYSASQSYQLTCTSVHDGDMLSFITALDLLPTPHLPTNEIQHDRLWRTSQIVPMGGRITLERINCPAVYCRTNAPLYPNHVYCDAPADENYVRVIVNDAVVHLSDCHDGPGGSCPMHDFERRVLHQGWAAGDFRRVCGLDEGAPDRVTFLHQGGDDAVKVEVSWQDRLRSFFGAGG